MLGSLLVAEVIQYSRIRFLLDKHADEEFIARWNFFRNMFAQRKIWSTTMLLHKAHDLYDRDAVLSVVNPMCYKFHRGEPHCGLLDAMVQYPMEVFNVAHSHKLKWLSTP